MGELGIYRNFPSFAHLDVSFLVKVPRQKAATLITGGFGKLNGFKDRLDTSVARHSGLLSVDRSFEIGIAEGLYFNYLDERELELVSKLVHILTAIDFIVYINYRYSGRRRVVNLLPDRYLVRVVFDPPSIKVFHMGGLRRTEPADLLRIIVNSTNSQAESQGEREDVLLTQGLSES